MLDARTLYALGLAALLALPARGLAQDAPTAVLVPPTPRGDDVESVSAALDRILRTRLGAHGVVELGPTPGLGLEDLLLALGCVAESVECLGQLAAQLEADELLLVNVERVDGALVVSLRRLHDGELEVTTRQYPGEGADNAALDDADAMVRQAYGLPPATAQTTGGGGAPASPPPPPRPDDDGGYSPVAPLILIGVGVAAMGVGVGLGVASQESLAAYEASPVTTEAEIDAALALYDRAEAEAIAADVLLPVGGALAAAGAIVWIVGATAADSDDDVAWDVSFGADGLMATVRGRFDGGAQ